MHPDIMNLTDSANSSMDRMTVGCDRIRPIVHGPVDPPVCEACRRLQPDSPLFDFECDECQALFNSHSTSVSESFALLRQWSPQVQQHVGVIIQQMLNAGAHVDDRDGLTDMTMLHYVCKSGARGIGDKETTCRALQQLLELGADPYIRCRWTNMAAIHYAVYFDAASVLVLLLQATKGIDVDSVCSEFDNGMPLHIAARNLAVESASVLLEHGAYPFVKDGQGKLPIDLIPDPASFDPGSEAAQLSAQLRKLLSEAEPTDDCLLPFTESLVNQDALEMLMSVGLKIGERVVVGGAKTGTLRFCGHTLFASGIWAGIELDEAAGKNNGSIDGIPYFHCPPNYGIFAPLNKIGKPGLFAATPRSNSLQRLNYGKVDVGHVTAKVDTGLKHSLSNSGTENIQVGDRVLVAGKRIGLVQFIGPTEFASGVWFGIELLRAVGKNDGSVNGKRYFSCAPQHGVFAPPSRIQKLQDGATPTESVDTSLASVSAGNINSQLSVESSASQKSASAKKAALRTKTVREFFARNSVTSLNNNNPANTSSSTTGEMTLVEGTTVFCSGEMGVIRYIGPVDFADGVWLGVELKTPHGKHDGSVQGRRYFSCRQNHGLLVRPSRVSVRGINGMQLRLNC